MLTSLGILAPSTSDRSESPAALRPTSAGVKLAEKLAEETGMERRSRARGTAVATLAAVLLAGSSRAGATNLVQNGDFAADLDGWTSVVVSGGSFAGFPKFAVRTDAACLASQAGNPFGSIDVPGNADGYVAQSLDLPGAATTLSFRSWGNDDPVTVTISVVPQGGPVTVLESYVPPALESHGGCSGNVPVTKSYDLAPFAGQTVTLRFEATASGYNGTIADFDDITVAVGCEALADTAAVACYCAAGLPNACGGQSPRKTLTNGLKKGCNKAFLGIQAGAGRKGRRLLGAASRRMKTLAKAVTRPKVKKGLSAECVQGLSDLFGAIRTRTEALRFAP